MAPTPRESADNTESSDNPFMKLLEALFNILKKLMGKTKTNNQNQNQNQNQAIEHYKKLDTLSESLKKEYDTQIKKGDFLKSYMIKSQQFVVDSMKNCLIDQDFDKLNEKQASMMAFEQIQKEMKELNTSNDVQEQFNDYHNHDPKKLKEAMDYCNSFVNNKTNGIGFTSEKKIINSIMKKTSEAACSYMSQAPVSHYENIGVTKENNTELTSDKNNSKNNSYVFDNESSLGR